MIRYLSIVSDAASIALEQGTGGHWVKLDLFGGGSPIPRQRMEYGLLTLLTFCRWMVGHRLKPLMTAFTYPQPPEIAPYEDAFGSQLQWNAKFNAFLLSEADLVLTLPTAIPQLAQVHERIAGLELLKLEKPATTLHASEAIARRLQDGTPLRSTIASDLRLSYQDQSTFFRSCLRWFGEYPSEHRSRLTAAPR